MARPAGVGRGDTRARSRGAWRWRGVVSSVLLAGAGGAVGGCIPDAPRAESFPRDDAGEGDSPEASAAILRDDGGLDACALDGGACDAGEGGAPTDVSSGAPLDTTIRGRATDVVAGSEFGCARLEHGTVACWGWNQYAQTGHRPASSDPVWTDATGTKWTFAPPHMVKGIADATQLSAGLHFACAVTRRGSVACWGKNDRGQLGHPISRDGTCTLPSSSGSLGLVACNAEPIQVEGLSASDPVRELRTGSDHACVLTQSGRVFCWGNGENAQLGRWLPEGVLSTSTPVEVSLPEVASSIGLGNYFSCAVGRSARVWCWGANYVGELGRLNPPRETYSPAPTLIAEDAEGRAFTEVASLRGGGLHACALKLDGSLWCWGNNARGQLGAGQPADLSTWKPARVSALAARARSLSVFYGMQGVIDAYGVPWMWGANSFGELGDGTLDGAPCGRQRCKGSPQKVPALAARGVRSLAVGIDAAYAVDNDGAVWGWGSTGYGALGRLTRTAAAGGVDRADCVHADSLQSVCSPVPEVIVPASSEGP